MHVFRMHAEDQYRLAGKFLLDVAEQVETAAAGHGEIEDRHVPLHLAGELQRLVAVGGFTHYGSGRIGREHLLQAVTDDRMIVGYENSHCSLFSLSCSLWPKSIGRWMTLGHHIFFFLFKAVVRNRQRCRYSPDMPDSMGGRPR